VRPEGDLPENRVGKTNPRFVKIAKYTAIGLQLPSTIIGGFVLGYLADRFLGTSPWLLIAMTFLAFVGAVIHLVQLVRRFGTDRS
jgi:F0F1-type ATP synthase assembly protein I